ncbi:ATP-binding cassette domain-containing protein [Nocardioides sp. AE5]|uniref:ABC transporter ATP-binding protein n=1 Tax=Nocardioides sp. AE5 TaxID=2962573 RepID=UPI0028826297|nr:ATP-binding cassette domain-containing protein [Nocardioides sp. AE5]MDT0202858.1 ATP-binding cassette domain-containing protein [Nocardioides sp. AE5]
MPRLAVDRLTKAYGDKVALDQTSFEVAPGEIFGFVGSNGAGKTTTMRIILGVLQPDSGSVTWDGEPVGADHRRRIGYMPEERGLYPKMKVGDQLAYLARLYGLSAADARASMERWTERLGVGERIGDAVEVLSLGNQQRIQLAAALTHEPEALVLDEPFSGLDPVAVDVMSEVLRERAGSGVPVLFSSHQLDLVERLCDRVGIIRDGRMVAVGTVDELARHDTPRWVVQGPADATWVPAGFRVVADDAAGTVVEVPETEAGAEQRLLAAALAAGPVTTFTQQRPSLTDLYRDVVTAATEEETA